MKFTALFCLSKADKLIFIELINWFQCMLAFQCVYHEVPESPLVAGPMSSILWWTDWHINSLSHTYEGYPKIIQPQMCLFFTWILHGQPSYAKELWEPQVVRIPSHPTIRCYFYSSQVYKETRVKDSVILGIS